MIVRMGEGGQFNNAIIVIPSAFKFLREHRMSNLSIQVLHTTVGNYKANVIRFFKVTLKIVINGLD